MPFGLGKFSVWGSRFRRVMYFGSGEFRSEAKREECWVLKFTY